MDNLYPDRIHAPKVHIVDNLSLPAPERRHLGNGMELLILDGGSQHVNQLVLCWNGGVAESPTSNEARLMAQMMTEGTATLTGAQVSEKIDFCGALLSVNADLHHTLLSLTSLNSLTADVLPVVCDIITHPSFPADTYVKIRDKMARNFALSMAKVMPRAHQTLMRLICGEGNPLSRPNSEDMILGVDREAVVDTWRRMCTASACTAFLSGRLDHKVVGHVVDMLESLPVRGAGIELDVQPMQPCAPCVVEEEMPSAVQAGVLAAIPAPSRRHPHYVPLRFAVMALGGYFGSRLMKNIREDKGYTYGINASLVGHQSGSFTLIGAQTDPKFVTPLIDELRAELTRMATVPLSADDMQRLRQHMSLTFMETLDTPFSTMDFYRALHTVDIPSGYFEQQQRMLREITPELICEMASLYLRPDDLRIVVAR